MIKVVRADQDDPDSDYVIMMGTAILDIPASPLAEAEGRAEQIRTRLASGEKIDDIVASYQETKPPGM